MGTTMAPGFDPGDYEHGDRQSLLAAYPAAAEAAGDRLVGRRRGHARVAR
jgi:hypothetical protein